MNKPTINRAFDRCQQWGSRWVQTLATQFQPPALNPGSLKLPGFSFSFFPTPATVCFEQGKANIFSTHLSLLYYATFFQVFLRNNSKKYKVRTELVSILCEAKLARFLHNRVSQKGDC